MDEKRSRRTILKAIGATGVVGLAGCNSQDGGEPSPNGATPTDAGTVTETPEGESGDVVIGSTNHITGKFSSFAPPITKMTELVVDEVNSAGGVLGRDLSVNEQDGNSGSAQVLREVITQFANVNNVPVISGVSSNSFVNNWDLHQEIETPVVSNWAGLSYLDTRGGDHGTPSDLSDDGWVWRTLPSDSNTTIGAALLLKDLGAESVAIMHTPQPGSKSISDELQAAISALEGIEVVNTLEYRLGKSSYNSELDRLFQEDFDAWFLTGGETATVKIAQAWEEGGYGKPLMIEDAFKNASMAQDLSDVVSQDAEIYSYTGRPTGDAQERVTTKAKERFDEIDLNVFVMAKYDSLLTCALAIERAGSTDPHEVQKNIGPVGRPPGTEVTSFSEGKEALANGDDVNFQGALTDVNFTEYGDVASDVAGWTLSDREFTEDTVIASSDINAILNSSSYKQ
jgi:ABC-type branched-subunit amino acid transport system substrate-binding protein